MCAQVKKTALEALADCSTSNVRNLRGIDIVKVEGRFEAREVISLVSHFRPLHPFPRPPYDDLFTVWHGTQWNALPV
jgi:hypothetical protein